MKARQHFDSLWLVVGILVLWQTLHGAFGEVSLSSPMDTGWRLLQLLASSRFWSDMNASASALGVALLISCFGGVVLGVALGINRLSAEVAGPLLISLYSLPKVIFYPMTLLIFGLGLSSKIAFGALHGIIPVSLFTMHAVLNVRPVLYRTAQTMWLTRWQTITRILIPATLPQIIAGVRLGIGLTLLGVLFAEMFASKRGVGSVMFNAIELGDSATILAITVLIATFAIGENMLLLAIERRLHHRA